jgi:SAM-dependent methyltransferase
MQANLQFASGDATTLTFLGQFDIVTAARTLQWIAEPAAAVSRMKDALKPKGILVILDYNHSRNEWEPDPPHDFKLFYEAFLAWRRANHWDNKMADHLPELFRAAGLLDVESHGQDDIAERGEPEFSDRTRLWSETIESVGGSLVSAGFCTKRQLQEARERYDRWVKTALNRQTLSMRAVRGATPPF